MFVTESNLAILVVALSAITTVVGLATFKGETRGVLESKDKSSIPLVGRSVARPKLVWSAPTIVEMVWNNRWQQEYERLAA